MTPTRDEPLVLGIDLGTSAVKVVAAGPVAGVLASGAAGFLTFSEEPGQAEQNPADWLVAVHAAMADLDVSLGTALSGWRSRIGAIGLTGQLPTLVCVGDQGPIGRAITWKDARADEATGALLDATKRRELYERTGMPVDGRYLGPMFRHHWTAHRQKVNAILSAKDFLAYALTGNRVTDPSTAAGYGAYDFAVGGFSDELCRLWEMPRDLLPAVCPAHSAAGTLSRPGSGLLGLAPGIPVSVGAADSVSSALAMAGLEEGVAAVTMGSSTIIIDTIRQARLDPFTRYLLTPHVEPGWYGREMDLLATGTGYRWLSDLLGLADGVLDRRAAQSPPGANGLMFSPYLAGGEQGALWDPALRGAVSGLTLRHTSSDLARAFLEGVGFEIRRCLSVLAETAPVREVVLSGHLTEHQASLQMLADILNQPIQPYPAGSPAALGAAFGALQMIAPGRPTRRLSASWPPVIHPSANADIYHRLYAIYLTRTRAQRSADATRLV